MTRFEELMNDQVFVDSLDNATSYQEVEAAFAKEGVDLNEVLPDEDAAAELSEDDLENVTGGVSSSDLVRIVKAAYKTVKAGKFGIFKFGASCVILLHAYYDVQRYGNATRTYSEKQIMNAAKTLGCV